MYELQSEVAQLLRPVSPEHGVAARGLHGFLAGSTWHITSTARLELGGATHEQLACVITALRRYCKKGFSRVQYNIGVVSCTQKLLVTDAV